MWRWSILMHVVVLQQQQKAIWNESLSFDLPQCIVGMSPPSSPSLSSSSLPLPFCRIRLINCNCCGCRVQSRHYVYPLSLTVTSGFTVMFIGAGFIASDLQTRRRTQLIWSYTMLQSFRRAIQYEWELRAEELMWLVSQRSFGGELWKRGEGRGTSWNEAVVPKLITMGVFKSADWKYFFDCYGEYFSIKQGFRKNHSCQKYSQLSILHHHIHT